MAPEGGIAALMAAVLASFFSAQDDPVPQILEFLVDIGFCFVLSAVYLFVVLPQATDFATLVLALSPFYLLLGAVPRTRSIVLNGTMMMTLTAAYSADFASYINSSLASAAGIAAAAVVTALVRSIGADVAARRLKRACRRDVALAAEGAGKMRRPTLAALLLDRIAALAPRLAGPDADERLQNALRDLNVGLRTSDVRDAAEALPPAFREPVTEALARLGAHYRAPDTDDGALLASLDHALAAVNAAGPGSAGQLAMDILAIRLNLFPDDPVPAAAASDGPAAP